MGHTLEIPPGKMKSVCLLAVIVCVALASEEVRKSPRLFYVSTSASTTVISTALCYISSDTDPLECPGRKKRRVVVDGETGLMVQPSQSGVETLESEDDRALIEIVLIWREVAGCFSIGSPQPQSPPPPLTLQPGVLAQSLALLLGQLSVDSYSGSFL